MGREGEVPGRTVVRLGWRGADRLERGEVHWPGKGKGSKAKKTVWRCALLEAEEADVEDLERPLQPP